MATDVLTREQALTRVSGASLRHEVRLGEDDGHPALLVDGIVQSIAPESALRIGRYWAAMVPDRAPERALILGLGGGTLANLLSLKWKQAEIVGVDSSEDVLEMARAAGWLDVERLEVVQADAFDWVKACRQRFDYVAIDLYHGERIPRRVFGRPFLRDLCRIMTRYGHLAVNLERAYGQHAQIARLEEFFVIRKMITTRGNIVLHALCDVHRHDPSDPEAEPCCPECCDCSVTIRKPALKGY